MNSRIFGKLIAILFFAVLYTWMVRLLHTHYMDMGRDAFMAKEGDRYDRLYTHNHSVVLEFIVCGILACILFGIYELVAFLGSLIGKKLDLDLGE